MSLPTYLGACLCPGRTVVGVVLVVGEEPEAYFWEEHHSRQTWVADHPADHQGGMTGVEEGHLGTLGQQVNK